MISRLLCPTGKSHSLPLRHLIHDHCLFVYAFLSLGCSRNPFTFTFLPASLACFYVYDGASSTSYFCTRPQGLVYKPRTFSNHQSWFMGVKSHFCAWCLWNKYFQSRSPILKSFHLGVWEISNSTCLKSTIFPPQSVTHSYPCLSWWHLQSFQLL